MSGAGSEKQEMIRLPRAKIENAVGLDDERTADVFFEKENSRLIATDGIGMVVIPVESDYKDISGRIPVWAIRVARLVGGTLGLSCVDKLVISANRGIFCGKRPVLDFPAIDRVISLIDSGKDQAIISLDARKLLQLAEALSDSGEWHCVTLHVRGPREPILVKPDVKTGDSPS